MLSKAEQKKIVDFAKSKVGKGYIMGATGWIATQARLDQQAAQYPGSAEQIRKYGKQWIGIQCYDCAQLTKAAAKEIGVSLLSGATAQATNKTVWADGGTIDTLPVNEGGIMLYRYDASTGRYQHTGVYLGDGTFIDASTTQTGVIHRAMSKYKWTHWRRLKSAGAIIPPSPPPKPPEGGSNMENILGKVVAVNPNAITAGTTTVNLRAEKSANSTRLAKIGFEGRMLVLEDPEDGWIRVEYGDLTGWVMKQFVMVVNDPYGKEPPDPNPEVPPGGLLSAEKFMEEVQALVQKYFGNG